MKTNWLANIFVYIREVVEEADRPLSFVIIALLPLLAPAVPAFVTANSLQLYMDFDPFWGVFTGIVFEGAGYVGMISLVGAIMRYVKEENNKRISLPVKVAGWAYGLYLFALISVNIILEVANGVPLTRVLVVACLTVGLSVSASLLNGQRIYERDNKDIEEKRYQDQRADKMEKYRIKHGAKNVQNVQGSGPQLTSARQFNAEVLHNADNAGDWRKARKKMQLDTVRMIANADIDWIMQKYNLRERAAYNWKNRAKREIENQ